MTALIEDQPDVDVVEADQPEHTGGMVALIPTEEDAAKLAVEGGDPAEQLHLTLAFLGDDVTDWDPAIAAAVHEVARKLTDPSVEQDDDQPVPAGYDGRGPGQRGPLMLTIFAHSHFNPNGGPDGQEPCMVYQFGDSEDLDQVTALHAGVCYEVKEAIGEVNFPEQHSPYKPHITAGYNLPPDALSYTGPVMFDRLRVALAGEVTDYPLGGGSMDEMTAAVKAEKRDRARKNNDTLPGTDKYPIENCRDAQNAIRRVGTTTEAGEDVRRHIIKQIKKHGCSLDMIPDHWNADGSLKASAELDPGQREALTAAATAMIEKLGPVGAHGVAPQVFQTPESLAFVDSLIELPAVDDALTASGDQLPPAEWFERPADLPSGTGHYVDGRRVFGRLAEWNVPHIGFGGQKLYPPRSPSGYRWFHTKSARVQGADGPQRIKIGHLTFGTGHAPTDRGIDHIAAAAHYDNSGYRGAKVRVGEDDEGIWYAGALCAGIEGAKLEEFEESDTSGDWRRIMGNLELVAALCVNVGGFPKVGLSLAASGEPLALVASAKAWGNPAAVVDVDAIAAAVVSQMERRTQLASKRAALLAALDDSPEHMAELLEELDDGLGLADDEIALVDGMPDPTSEEVADVESVMGESLTAAVGRRGKNWIEQTGTGHLPRYIKRISKHLRAKGMSESRSIAVAVNVVKRACKSGDLNFPGLQRASAKTRAQACAAVAEWEAKRAQAKAI